MLKRFKKHFKNQKGLTLVELLAVIVILGIIAAIAVPSIGNIIENSKKDAHAANAHMVISAAKIAKVDGLAYDYPTTGTDPKTGYQISTLVSGGYLDDFNDADNNAASYDGASFVKYDDTSKTFKVYLKGSKFSVGTAAAPLAAKDIKRTNVSVTPTTP
ncbi:competence type IV pilus major pilin ComGC [Peribacillus acanthi]|uniref:competence type IV pilus major pilin ComGC n=1 Tax=Peribacillus acanthi TaxID=2171554 RepID=UPI000D3E11E2|nr:type II secretion system protein [Peribacillus acanthi]